MPAEQTVISSNSKTQDSRVLISNLGGMFARVNATPTATEVVLADSSGLTGKNLYSSTNPGQLVVVKAAAGSAHHGKVSDITGITSDTLTVDVDLSAVLAAGDVVAVLPPLASEIFTNGGHTLQTTMEFDEGIGIGQTFQTHTTRLGVAVQGDIPFKLTRASESVLRLLALGIGGYDKSGAAQHDFVPFKTGLTGIDQLDDGVILARDGNSTIQQAFFGLFGTQLTLEIPQGGTCTGNLSVIGCGVVREIGGTGKAFTTGANNWIPAASAVAGDAGEVHSYRGALVELGGSFGDATNLANIDRYFGSATVTFTRNGTQDRPLGNEFIMKPIETEHRVTISGTRVLENDTAVFERYFGGSTAASPGEPQTTRLVLRMVHPGDATKVITLDVPRGHFTAGDPVRQAGRVTQNYTFTAVHTLNASDQIDATIPLYRLRVAATPDIDIGTAL